jgi:ABC-type branched-subunit amino acid transport system ATPase component
VSGTDESAAGESPPVEETETDKETATDEETTIDEETATSEEPSSAAGDASTDGDSPETDLTELVEDDPETHAGDEAGRYAPLEVEGLRKEFGGITAVDDVTFDVEEGTLTGLIGPNGAGKSTTFNLITGMLDPTDGTVRFNGEEITGLPPHEIANRGLARTFQIARELEEMTVLENMMLAPKGQVGESLWRSIMPLTRGSVREQETEQLERVWEVLDFFEIDHLAQEYAGNLSGGQRKLLEMARALLTDPDVLLLDEPFAGVNPTLEKRLLDHIHELRDRGYTFLIVEHDMDLIMNNCERVIVMHQGRILKDGTPAEIKESEEVIEAYLGGEV